jgi:metacaspase-1
MTARRETLCAALLSAALAQAAAAGDHAVVVGIDAYPDLSLSQPLSGARADAERFGAFLVAEMGFGEADVTLLTDEAATAEAIMEAVIEGLISRTGPGDRAVFYFAGLGSLTADGRRVLLAHDAPDILGNLPEDALAEILDLLEDRQATVVIDASFRAASPDLAGSLALGRSLALGAQVVPDAHGLRAYGTGTAGRDVWNAAAPDQDAWEAGSRGVFTDAFIDGLSTGAADGNGNGTTTNAELLAFVRDRSSAWCAGSADCTAEAGALLPVFDGALQSAPFAPVTPAATDSAPTPAQPLPVSTGSAKALGVVDTLGFVTDLFTPSNAANLRLEMTAGGPLRVGDRIRISVSADRPGTLVLLDVNPKGELAQIFPSRLAMTGTTRIAAGETLTIPNGVGASGAPLTIRVTEPAGEGFLLGLFIEDDLPALTALLPENLDGGPVPNAGQYLYEIAQDLLRLQTSGAGSTAAQWSAAYLPYEILP